MPHGGNPLKAGHDGAEVCDIFTADRDLEQLAVVCALL